jgi:hypothetical protein
LRVGDVTADSDPPKQAPVHEQRFDATEVGEAKIVTFTEITPAEGPTLASQPDTLPTRLGLDVNDGAVGEYDVFASIYNPGKIALLVGWKNPKAADLWKPVTFDGVEKLRHRRVRVVRDYGRFDRREAPQFYPDVKGRDTRHAEPAAHAS